MRKVFVLASLTVMTASVFGMSPDNSNNTRSTPLMFNVEQNVNRFAETYSDKIHKRKEEIKIIFTKFFHKTLKDKDFILNFLIAHKNKEKMSKEYSRNYIESINNEFESLITKFNQFNQFNHGLVGDYSYFDVLLRFSVSERSLELVKCSVRHGANVNKENNEGRTPLFSACKNGHENVVKYLVETCKADVNKSNKYGATPLFSACENGHENIVKYLVEQGADINKANRYGNTPLYIAYNRYENIAKYLVEHGVDKTDEYGMTPSFYACISGDICFMEYLVEHGADVNKTDEYGMTPLFYACWKGNENIVKYLVEHGADINKENEYGETPLFKAFSSGNENIVKYLIKQGAGVNNDLSSDFSDSESD